MILNGSFQPFIVDSMTREIPEFVLSLLWTCLDFVQKNVHLFCIANDSQQVAATL